MVKNGKTSAGRTRWRCPQCGALATKSRNDVTRRAEFTAFLTWITSCDPQQAFAPSARTFLRKIAWYWRVSVPHSATTGEVHEVIMLDGTYLSSWYLLIAYNTSHVLS
ncbi:IS1/IS1595 family N-terminal zinc-binding domain-containing protein [Schaalia cardiffensis]